MRNRNHRIRVRLNEAEYVKFKKSVARAGISQEAFLRQLIAGYAPREKPPPDYYAMMEELRRVGNNLNQIARVAHALGKLDTKGYDENAALYRETLRKITEAVIAPEKVKT